MDGMLMAKSFPMQYHYYQAPIIESIFPTVGSILGSTTITLHGSSFVDLPGLTCHVGDVSVPSLWMNEEEVTCITPLGSVASSHVISLSLNNGVDTSKSPEMFRYTAPPLIQLIWPTKGSVKGGSILTLDGQHFENTTELQCIFRQYRNNTVLTTDAEYISSTQLSCTSPAVEKPTFVSVHATINGVDDTISPVSFEFIEDAIISSIKPDSGPINGGTVVTLIGSGMVNGDTLRCRFGNKEGDQVVHGNWISETEISCITPVSESVGTTNVTLSLNGVDYYTSSAVNFLYYNHPIISSIYPTFGASHGGTSVTIHGSGFQHVNNQDSILCRFGDVKVIGSTNNDESVSCVSAGGKAGSSHLVSISLNGGVDFTPTSIEYRYISPVELYSISPTWSDGSGGTMLNVTGSGFKNNTDDLRCIFQNRQINPIHIKAEYISSTELQCASPQMTAPSELALRVTVNGVDVSSSPVWLEYVPRATVTTMKPTRGLSTGGTQVTLIGDGFMYEDTICCRFGESTNVPAQWLSWAMVRCVAPPSSAVGDVIVSYSNDCMNFVNVSISFSFISVSNLEPNYGSKLGGVEVEILGEGFTNEDGWKCQFGTRSVPAMFVSMFEIHCITPAVDQVGMYQLSLFDQDGSSFKTGLDFYYHEDLQVESAFPESSPVNGGSVMTIKLNGLQVESSYVCIFSDTEMPATILHNTSQVECTIPSWDKPEETSLIIKSTNTSMEISTDETHFTFYEEPSITSATPTTLYSGFSKDVKVTGSLFFNSTDIKCRFGEHEVEAQWISDTEVVCRYKGTSIEPDNNLPLSISMNGGIDFHDSYVIMNIHQDLTVTSISPSYGSSSGSTRVTILGTGFDSSFTYRCLFDTKFTGAELESHNEILCDYAPVQTGKKSVWLCFDSYDCIGGGDDMEFEYLDPLKLLDVQPQPLRGPSGTLVRVTTNHPLGNHSVCLFGEHRVKLEPTDDFGVGVCESPSHNETTTSVAFSISANGQEESSYEQYQFTYHSNNDDSSEATLDGHNSQLIEENAVRVSYISPTMGLQDINVTVFGSGFANLQRASCVFGTKQVPVIPVSNTSIICTSPWNTQFETVPFMVIDASKDVQVYHGDDNMTFTHVERPYLVKVEPEVIIKTNTSTAIIIEGQNFDVIANENISCRVGLSESSASFSSSGTATCNHTFPETGMFQVELLSNQYGVITSSRARVQVIEIPHLHHLEPPILTANYDDTNTMMLMIKGNSFVNRNLVCYIDDQPCPYTTFILESEVLCHLPKGLRPKTYKVRLSNNVLDEKLPYLPLEVIPPPSIAALSPSMGEAGGNVTITGKAFHPQMEVKLGEDIVPSYYINSTLIQCHTSPYSHQESVPVYITLNNVPVSTGLPQFFTFVDLSLDSISPNFGDTTGGTRVTFKLKTESPGVVSHCKFGGIIVPASIDESNELVCVSPAMSNVGQVHVGVSVNNGEDFSMSQHRFEYTKPAEFTTMSPSSGSETGGNLVVLSGSNFVNSNTISCFFGHVESVGRWMDDENLVCETPLLEPRSYEVKVTLNGVDVLDTQQMLTVYARMTALFSLPSFGETGGNTAIQVHGTNYREEDKLTCRFGGLSSLLVDARYIDSNIIECITPKWDKEEHVDLTIISEIGDTAFLPFEFYEPFHISSIHPNNGFLRGGTNLTVNGNHFSRAFGPVQCLLGNTTVNAVVVSEDEIRCTTPPYLSSGDVEFAIIYGADTFALVDQSFQYQEEMVLDTISPHVVPSTTDKMVTVFGSMFQNRKELGCLIKDEMEMDAKYISESQVMCQVPRGLRPGNYTISVSNNGQDYSTSSIEFNVIDLMLVRSIHPMFGTADTTQVISLELDGSNFQQVDNLGCLVDEKYIVPSNYINSTLIQCHLPLNVVEKGTVSIGLVLDGVPISTGPLLQFTFIDLSLTSIRPRFGDTTGGTRVTFHLRDRSLISGVTHCKFGDSIVPAIGHHSEEVVCVSPPTHGTPQHVSVGVSVNNGDDFSMSQHRFEYTKPAEFTNMSPSSGSEIGGTMVVLSGSNFVNSNTISCFFGHVESVGLWVSKEKITCEAPSMKPGNYKLRVSFNDIDTLRTSWQFTFHKEIDVLYASPSSGSIVGGTELSIIGKSFVSTENLTCQFGDLGLSEATYITSTELSCQSPDVSKETLDVVTDVDLRVSLNGLDYSSAAARFRFTPQATIHSIFPTQGSISGGTQVTVHGTNMFPSITSNTAMCIFGNETVPATLRSTQELSCISPSHSINEDVFFGVSLNGVDLVTQHRPSSFLYLPIVKTVSIEPSGGPFTGGTVVTVSGDDFDSSSRCKFGSTYSDDIVYISNERIQCRSPSHPPGTVSFVVSGIEDDGIAQEDVAFDFYKPPTILFANPTTGPPHGGTIVRVYGKDYRSNVNYLCFFEDIQVSGQFVATDAIECQSPRMLLDVNEDAHKVDLRVAEAASNFTAMTLQYTYTPAPSLDSLSPLYVFFDGTDSITIKGDHLNTTGDAWCRFTLPTSDGSYYYETVKTVSVLNNEHIDCQVPAYESSVTTSLQVDVQVSTNQWDYSAALSFNYAPRPTIDNIYPILGSVNGGTVVTIQGANFLQESNLYCTFDNTESSVPATFVSSRHITCKTPAVSYPINSSIALHFEDNDNYVEGSQFFNYHRELSLEDMSPARGFTTGATIVTVTGTGFIDVPTISCMFGSILVEGRFKSSNEIECLSPQVSQAECVEILVALNSKDFSSFAVTERGLFTYDDDLNLFYTIPSNIPNEYADSSSISVFGSSFVNTTTMRCMFGQDQDTDAHYISESEVKCTLPDVLEVGEVDIRISTNGIDFSRKKTSLSIVRAGLISSISPQRIQEGHAVEIVVKGDGFIQSSDLQCRFGLEHSSPARWIDNSTLKCITPLLNLTHDGVEYVAVSNNGGYDIGQQSTLEVTSRVHFISMHPVFGYVTGGTDVVIELSNAKYMNNLICQFGIESLPATLISGNSVICTSPPYEIGEVLLKLTDGIHVLASGTFEYIKPPLINSLQPTIGPLAGGTTVILKGAGLTGVSHCRFGIEDDSFEMVSANVYNDTSLGCITPAYERNGDTTIELTHNGEDFVGSGHGFSYRASPQLLSLEPTFGSDLGNKTLYIYGEAFIDTPTKIRFGDGALVDAIYISPTLLSCITPATTIGHLSVSITMNQGVDYISNESLKYESIKLPQLESIQPQIGIINGNTTVTINTTVVHEHHNLSCHFDKDKVQATYLSSNSVSCVAPPTMSADLKTNVNVSLSVDGERYLGADGLNTLEFTYYPEPEIISITPDFAWTVGGSEVTLEVEGLEPFSLYDLSCNLGDSGIFTKALQVKDDSTVTCQVPPFLNDTMKQHSPIELQIGSGINTFHIKTPESFSYYTPAIVTGIEPRVGSVRGGSLARVTGHDFTNMYNLQCLFGGDLTVDAEFIDEKEVHCTVPEWKGGPKTVNVHIGIKNGPRLSIESHASFEYQTHPSIQSIQPRFGSINGGTDVVIRGNALLWPDASDNLSCRFGNSSLVPVTVTDDTLSCTSPPFNEVLVSSPGKQVSVSLYHEQVQLATSDETFVYSPHIEVSSLSPNSGPFSGGTSITLSAQDLHHLPLTQMTCHFDNQIVSASYYKAQDILKCVSPAVISSFPIKTVMLNLGINGLRDVESIGRVFTYYRELSVSSINPIYGFLEGGEDVLVSGIGFRNKVGLGCKFDDTVSPKVVWQSDTSIICTSPSLELADTKNLSKTDVRISVTNNGIDYTDAGNYSYIHRPDATSCLPSVVNWKEETYINITGKNLNYVTGCRYGDHNKTHPALNVTDNNIVCRVPPATNRPLHFLPPLSQDTSMSIFIELDNGVYYSGLEIMYKKPPLSSPAEMIQPQITKVVPNHGGSDGGDWISVYGTEFLNTEGLACKFGSVLVYNVHYITSSEVRCKSPRHLPGEVKINVVNSGTGQDSSVGLDFTFVSDLSITTMFPSSGSIKGGTSVQIFGSFPTSSQDNIDLLRCKFGGQVVNASLVHQNEIACSTPQWSVPETVEVTISLDGGYIYGKSSTFYTFVEEIEIESLHPSYGYPEGNALIEVNGLNVRNATGLKCMFGEISVKATFISSDRVLCRSPSYVMERNNNNKVPVRLASDGEHGSTSWKYFEYMQPPQVTSISPTIGDSSQGGIDITVRGSGFRNVMQLKCSFGNEKVQAKVIDKTTLLCPIPPHPPGVVDFRIIDEYASYTIVPVENASQTFQFVPETSIYSVSPTWNATHDETIVLVKGTFDTSLNITCSFNDEVKTDAIILSESLLSCPMPPFEDKGDIQVSIGLHGSTHLLKTSIAMNYPHLPTASNGTTTMGHNITQCEPGTFQPQNGQEHCLPCPVGFICPFFGMSKPTLCDAGSICEHLGLVVPSSPCISGHYCNEGTKISSQIALESTDTWILEEETGVLTTAMFNNSDWDYVHRTSPATGKHRISHPPVNEYVKAEQPIPCPLGTFCKEGVSTDEHVVDDYTTPQPCWEGSFCPR